MQSAPPAVFHCSAIYTIAKPHCRTKHNAAHKENDPVHNLDNLFLKWYKQSWRRACASSKSRGDVLPLFRSGDLMSEISVFVDESSDQGGQSKYYLLALVFNNQKSDISLELEKYRNGLAMRGLDSLPFHASPIMNRHDDYKNMDFSVRKSYFSLFFLLLQHLPISYHTFAYKRSEVGAIDDMTARMRRDLTNLLFDKLEYFQSFDEMKIYYDDGQEMVAKALHSAIEYVISRQSVLYRKTNSADFVLAQAADMLCSLELAAIKFAHKEQSSTDEKNIRLRTSFQEQLYETNQKETPD